MFTELELPRRRFVAALVAFDVGVERGQLAMITAAFVGVAWSSRARRWYRRLVVVPAFAGRRRCPPRVDDRVALASAREDTAKRGREAGRRGRAR